LHAQPLELMTRGLYTLPGQVRDAVIIGVGGDLEQLLDAAPADRRHNAELSQMRAGMELIAAVCWRMNRCRVRCSIRQACWSGVFTGTKRMLGRCTASQIASASAASFFWRLT
jgi:hypothetical protein